jgi:putative ABC transport system permease protein
VDSQLILANAGDSMRFNFDDSHLFQDFSLAALTDEVPMGSGLNNTGHLILVMPESALANLTLPDQIRTHSMLFLRSTSPIELEQRIFNLHREIGVEQISVDNAPRTARITRNVKTLVTVFTTGFIVLISSICIANILNTITTSIALRRREFAMLKSVGMTPQSFGKMINFKAFFTASRPSALACPLASPSPCFSTRL